MKTILYIEDQPLTSRIEMLQVAGYKVIAKQYITDAYKYLKRHPVDIIILDVMMPPGDGFSIKSTKAGFMSGVVFVQKIKKLDSLKRIPIIVITANPDYNIKSELVSLGVLKYFAKPVSQNEIHAALKECLEGKRQDD